MVKENSKNENTSSAHPPMAASFSGLAMSIASSAAMSMGLAPDPQTGKINKDRQIARFNIDLLVVLQDKTKGNLTADEKHFMDAVITDLQMKFLTLN